MAYIPGYTFDIFISYAHTDNLKMPGELKGWVELFYESLRTKLDIRIGAKQNEVKIWWDKRRLSGDIEFDNSIQEGIRNSAIMISLLSNGYLKSDYCKQEMNLFHEKLKLDDIGASVGNRSRMIKVLLANINYTKLPEQFGKTTGFPFYKARDDDDYGESTEIADPIFKQQLKDITDSIVSIFEGLSIKKTEEKISPANPVAPGSSLPATSLTQTGQAINKNGFKIFFGEVSDSLRAARKRTITELEKNGYTIITNIPPPDEATAHDKKVTEELQKADLAVHLLDQFPGREIEGINNWYTKKQVELSLQLSPSKLLWVPAELDENEVEEESYKIFLQGLEKKNNPENKFEFIRGNKSELTREIMDYAVSVKQSYVRKESNEKISILLDTQFCDQQYAWSLGQELYKNNIQTYLNPEEDDPGKNMTELAYRISKVNKLVFLYGNASYEWVKARIDAALQLIVTNNYPIHDFYVYVAPPNKMHIDIKPNQRFLKVNIVNNSSQPDLNSDMLESFINALKKESA
ncbi:hypothetical protein BH10BAC2_BH10BAC2_22780 [soil metagenome]